jgi:hypothetical protein
VLRVGPRGGIGSRQGPETSRPKLMRDPLTGRLHFTVRTGHAVMPPGGSPAFVALGKSAIDETLMCGYGRCQSPSRLFRRFPDHWAISVHAERCFPQRSERVSWAADPRRLRLVRSRPYSPPTARRVDGDTPQPGAAGPADGISIGPRPDRSEGRIEATHEEGAGSPEMRPPTPKNADPWSAGGRDLYLPRGPLGHPAPGPPVAR